MHNCQTILQPPLIAVEHCTLPTRGANGQGYVSLAQERCEMVLKLMREKATVTQHYISSHLNLSGSTAHRTIVQLIDLGKIELVARHSKYKIYKIKEVMQ